MARPTKLTPKVQEKIVSAIRAGNYIETAAAYAGVSKSTLYLWLQRGQREKARLEAHPRAKMKRSEARYVRFSDAVEKALVEAEVRDVAIIVSAARDYWQAAAWRLERMYPERYGRRQVEVSGKVAVRHEVKEDVMARLAKYAELFEKLAGEEGGSAEGAADSDCS